MFKLYQVNELEDSKVELSKIGDNKNFENNVSEKLENSSDKNFEKREVSKSESEPLYINPLLVMFILHIPVDKVDFINNLIINIKSFALEEVLRQNLILIPNVVPDNCLRIAEKNSVMVEQLVVRQDIVLLLFNV